MRTFLICLAVVIGSVCAGVDDAAASRFRVSIDTALAHFEKNTTDYSEDGSEEKSSISSFGFGGGMSNILGFRMGLGLVLVDDLTLGTTLGVGGGKFTFEYEEYAGSDKETMRLFSYEFLPFVSYKFDLGKVQPFLTATLGYEGTSSKLDNSGGYKRLEHLFAFGGGAGFHYFFADSVSLDTSVLVRGRVGRLAIKDDGIDAYEKNRLPRTGVSANLLFGLSGWF